MKKLLLISLAVFTVFAAFAQGKVSFQTDSLHLVFWSAGSLGGQLCSNDNLPPGLPPLAADLYMGTSSSLLYLYSSATFGTAASGAGKWTSVSVLASANATTGAPNLLGGTTVFVEVQVRTSERAPLNIFDRNAVNFYALCGFSSEFTFTLGSGITYPVLWGANGNWPIGPYNLDSSVYGTGARGAITFLPEPSTMALTTIGAVGMLIFRRKSLS